MRVALYARVSKDDAVMEPENQLMPLRASCAEHKWRIVQEYVDRASAADFKNRCAWRRMMDDAAKRRFDVVFVWRLDRAFRSTLHAAESLDRLQKAGVALVSLTERWADGTTPEGQLMRTILLAFAEFERETIRTRTRAGLARARAKGVTLGRRPVLDGEFEAIRPDVKAGRISQRAAAKRLGVSPRTIARALVAHKGAQNGRSETQGNHGSAEAAPA